MAAHPSRAVGDCGGVAGSNHSVASVPAASDSGADAGGSGSGRCPSPLSAPPLLPALLLCPPALTRRTVAASASVDGAAGSSARGLGPT